MLGDEYRACVAVKAGKPGDSLPESEFKIPGGRYYCHRLRNFVSEPQKIGTLIDELVKRSDFDHFRPIVEYYRGHDELSNRLPVI